MPEIEDPAAAGGDGDETVVLSKAEHDSMQARLRVLEKESKDRKSKAAKTKAEAEKKAQEDQLAAAERAGLDKELQQTQAETAELKTKLRKVNTTNAIRDAAGKRGWSLSAQRAVVTMVDVEKLDRDDDGNPTAESVTKVFEELEVEYPDIYTATKNDGGNEGGRDRTTVTPSNPSALADKGAAKFKDFISPQDFLKTSFEERQTKEFRERLERSRASWPKTFNHRELVQG